MVKWHGSHEPALNGMNDCICDYIYEFELLFHLREVITNFNIIPQTKFFQPSA
jgi:hypothetical protein